MSKVEDLSRLYVLPFLDVQYEKYGEHKQMELSMFDGYDIMSAYEEGYHQAEKDLELTWDDIKMVIEIADKLICDNVNEIINNGIEWYYKEVLKRFKDLKHVK